MLLIIIRTLILLTLVIVVIRIMGKRQIGQLQPFELVIIIMLSELAAIPMQNTGVPLAGGVIPILMLLIAQLFLSYVSLKSERARGIICGTPTVLIEKGKILEKELARIRYNINDLLEQLRTKNIPNILDVEYAILETGGQLSVIPKSHRRPLVPDDININPSYEGLPTDIIIDGYLDKRSLGRLNLDETWLNKEINKRNMQSIKEVLLFSIDTQGNIYCQPKVS